jgi:hypothetical protein
LQNNNETVVVEAVCICAVAVAQYVLLLISTLLTVAEGPTAVEKSVYDDVNEVPAPYVIS